MVPSATDFLREILLSVPSGAEVPVPVRLAEITAFEFQIAERLWAEARGLRLWVRPTEFGRPTARLPSKVLFRRDRSVWSPFVLTTAEFSTATRVNTLRVTDWAKLFPTDVQERKDVLVPMLGRSIWRRLVAEGKISDQELITGINVLSGHYRTFEQMDDALTWAEGQDKGMVYFNRLEPGFWRVAKGIANE